MRWQPAVLLSSTPDGRTLCSLLQMRVTILVQRQHRLLSLGTGRLTYLHHPAISTLIRFLNQTRLLSLGTGRLTYLHYPAISTLIRFLNQTRLLSLGAGRLRPICLPGFRRHPLPRLRPMYWAIRPTLPILAVEHVVWP